MRDNYPYGLFAVPMSEIIRIHASSGTTGKPTVVGYTRRDIAVWSEVVARILTSAGVERDDYIHVAYGYGLFTGGLGIHYGSEKVGATVIPISLEILKAITADGGFGQHYPGLYPIICLISGRNHRRIKY